MIKKYVLHPDWVRSKNDNTAHFIDAHTLAHLYHVALVECVDARENRYRVDVASGRDPFAGMIHLYPRRDGDYTIPGTRLDQGGQHGTGAGRSKRS